MGNCAIVGKAHQDKQSAVSPEVIGSIHAIMEKKQSTVSPGVIGSVHEKAQGRVWLLDPNNNLIPNKWGPLLYPLK